MYFKERFQSTGLLLLTVLFSVTFISCEKEIEMEIPDGVVADAIFLLLDEDAIDNDKSPNSFSETDVNDNLARVGLRQPLRYFQNNAGRQINLYSGEVGDEGFYALKTIPGSWKTAGPAPTGILNYINAAPGLGGGEDDKEVLLDKIANITPLRATGLAMLTGSIVLAVVYDGDISMNYSPINGNLQGANLGLVAFKVLNVVKRTDGSSGSLPVVTVVIEKVSSINGGLLNLFSNAPAISSSSEPYDITPPASIPAIITNLAP